MLAQQVSPPTGGIWMARRAIRLAGAGTSDESVCHTAVAGAYCLVTMSVIVNSGGIC